MCECCCHHPLKASRYDYLQCRYCRFAVEVAAVFDALTSKRPYKEPWSIEQTIEHMQHQAGKHFDPHLVELFIGQIDTVLAIKKAHQERD